MGRAGGDACRHRPPIGKSVNGMVRTPAPLTAHTTYLEMTTRPKASLPVPLNLQTALIRTPGLPLPCYRYPYRQVGTRWHWYERLRLSDEELAPAIHDPRVSVTFRSVHGARAGFAYLSTNNGRPA